MKLFVKLKSKIQCWTHQDYFYSVVSTIVSNIVAFVYSVIYSRFFGPSLFGTSSVINTYSEMIMLVACLGIYQAYPFFKKQRKESNYHEFINIVSGLFLVYFAIAAICFVIHRKLDEITVVIILIPILFAVRQFNYVVQIERPQTRSSFRMLLAFFDLIFVGIVALIFHTSLLLLFSFIILRQIVYFIIAVLNLKVRIQDIRPTLKGSWKYVQFGILPMFTIILMEINYKADVIMMRQLSVIDAEIGIYSLGVTLAEKVWLIPDALKDILLSKLAKGKSEQEVSKIVRLSLWVVISIIIILLVLSKYLILLIFGEDYENSYMVIALLSPGIIGMIFYKMIYSYNIVQGKRLVNFIFLLMAAIANILGNILLIPAYGIYGASIASSISYVICGGVFLYYFHRNTNESFKSLLLLTHEDIKDLKSFVKK